LSFEASEWEMVDSQTYRNRDTLLSKSKVTFSREEQFRLELHELLLVKRGLLLIRDYLNSNDGAH
jgi:hypothetical protein